MTPAAGGDTLAATLRAEDAAARTWDVVVVGAGPAGAPAAWGCAKRGLSVLLLDKSAFPRSKVCGCCLNAASLRCLLELGLGGLPDRLRAPRTHELRLAAGGRSASVRLPAGVALSREALDAALVSHAVAAGAHFLPAAHAERTRLEAGPRAVDLRVAGGHVTVCAKVVLAADGLGGKLLDAEPGCATIPAPGSRMGVGARLDRPPASYHAGTIYMACHAAGYVGLVRLEDGTLDLAAALDPARVQAAGGPAAMVQTILASAGLPELRDLDELDWRGTPLLTRRRARLGAPRLLALGDAASYVEPFTGEGIAWALESGLAIPPIVERGSHAWSDDLVNTWESLRASRLARRQRACRTLTSLLRRPSLTRAAVHVLGVAPVLARPFIPRIAARAAC